MSLWREIRGAVRSDPDPSTQVDPRAERVAAAGVGTLVLCGAVGTYLVIAGGLAPLFAATTPPNPSSGPVLPTVTASPSRPDQTGQPSASPSPMPSPPTSRTVGTVRSTVTAHPHTSTPVPPVVTASDSASATPSATPRSTPTPTPSVTQTSSPPPAP